MLLTITTTHEPATDLGFLVHKHPERVHTAETSFGKVYVLYPEAASDRCTVSLLLDVDPVRIVRGGGGRDSSGPMDQYVNDRPYVASSFLSVAIGKVFREAMGGRSKERQELAETAIPLEARIAVVPCRGGEGLLRRLFEPLGYEIECEGHPLDAEQAEWGRSPYYTVTLKATRRLSDLLTHLYVLIPVLDNNKHYWVGHDEIEKLLAKGAGWLEGHPAKEEITRRYLTHRRSLVRKAMARLVEEEGPDPDEIATVGDQEEAAFEKPLSLNEQRLGAVVAALKSADARSVLDLGCGEGNLLRVLMKDRTFERLVGVDASHRALEVAARRLRLDRLPERQAERITLIHGALTYRDRRLEGFDAGALVEVIEHVDLDRLPALERILFECTRPLTVVVSTPNVEYNVLFENLQAGKLRHRDHRFEWTRDEFAAWCDRCSERWGYAVRRLPVGPGHEVHGAPTQMAVFTRGDES